MVCLKQCSQFSYNSHNTCVCKIRILIADCLASCSESLLLDTRIWQAVKLQLTLPCFANWTHQVLTWCTCVQPVTKSRHGWLGGTATQTLIWIRVAPPGFLCETYVLVYVYVWVWCTCLGLFILIYSTFLCVCIWECVHKTVCVETLLCSSLWVISWQCAKCLAESNKQEALGETGSAGCELCFQTIW